MIGASAHACSVLRPNWPFLKEMRVKDLSNHLQKEWVRGWMAQPWGLRSRSLLIMTLTPSPSLNIYSKPNLSP